MKERVPIGEVHVEERGCGSAIAAHYGSTARAVADLYDRIEEQGKLMETHHGETQCALRCINALGARITKLERFRDALPVEADRDNGDWFAEVARRAVAAAEETKPKPCCCGWWREYGNAVATIGDPSSGLRFIPRFCPNCGAAKGAAK